MLYERPPSQCLSSLLVALTPLNFPRIICYGWAGEKAKMKEYKMPHPNHENHLCYLENIGYIQEFPEAYKEFVCPVSSMLPLLPEPRQR